MQDDNEVIDRLGDLSQEEADVVREALRAVLEKVELGRRPPDLAPTYQPNSTNFISKNGKMVQQPRNGTGKSKTIKWP